MNDLAQRTGKGLLARYREVFRAAWEARAEIAGPRRLADEVAFLPAALSLSETPPHPAPRRAALAIILLFLAAFAWSVLGRVDLVAVAAGKIAVSDATKLIQPLESGVVRAIRVRDGDHVSRGQILVELDSTGPDADWQSAEEQLQSMRSEAGRTRALLQALPGNSAPRLLAGAPHDPRSEALLKAEWSDICAKRAKHDAELHHREAELATAQAMLVKLQVTVPLARRRESDIESLAEQGYVSSHAGQDKTRERIELERDLATQQAKVKEALAAVAESRDARASFIAETRHSLSDRQAQAAVKVAQLEQETAKGERKAQLTQLSAPVDGTVQQLSVHTTGGVVTAAQQLMVIVPDSAQLSAEVAIDNKDIGFVRLGQAAEVKLETFPFTRYGTVPATVSRVTGDAVNDEKRGPVFQATLALKSNAIAVDGKAVRLSPGMALTAEVKTGRQRVIDYLLSPVRQRVEESFKER